jgi:phenylalanyl-tRNA synthetase alpha chain
MMTINDYLSEVSSFTALTKDDVEQFRLKFLSKKGILAALFADMKNIAPEERKAYGLQVNELKLKVEERLASFQSIIDAAEEAVNAGPSDRTLPAEPMPLGSRHPIQLIRNKIIGIFARIGFTVADGPEIEDDWHNFTALNFPENHPARDMQDTFYISTNPAWLLRTHTSNLQIRAMENSKPPIRIVTPGRVYRNETISARSHCFFHQIEGLYVDENVSFADLKQTLYFFVQEMFGKDVKVRFRPSYFPFTEPSAEMDISCLLCNGEGCSVCKKTGWLEILGCGMVHPKVLDNCGIDSNKYTGFAFGMGIERPALLKYGIKDIRLFSENDVRFLKQFTGAI